MIVALVSANAAAEISIPRVEQKRTLRQGFGSLAGAIGVAWLFPIAILIVGLPVVFAVRIVSEVIAWLTGGSLN